MKEETKEVIDKLKKLCYDDYCLEFSVDDIDRKEEKILLDYITDLQEENKILKELNVCVGCNNNPNYKQRNEKAIEYLHHFDSDELCENITGIAKILLNILKGDKDDN